MKRWIINILIVLVCIGIIILGYQIFSKYYFNFVNENNIEEYLEENFNLSRNNTENNINKKSDDNQIPKEIPLYNGYKVLGAIKIDEIDLSYPIIEANENKDEALKVSIIKFYGSNLNEKGNVVLAGHNYYDSTMFARLHLLNKDDTIKIIDSLGNSIEYSVYDKYNTSPNDTTCLETLDFDKKEITLITCTKGNTQRLVIKAKEIN